MTGGEADELITIGTMARASGLTTSALRFYDDGGLLIPARVDETTGYRYYTRAQSERAVLIRRLRGVGVPLGAIAAILAGDPDEAERLLDHHVRELERRAQEAARVAAAVKHLLGARRPASVSGATLAHAIGQVAGAAARDHDIPVLAGVFVEVNPNSVTLTATDRYRLSTRTLVADQHDGGTWSAVVETTDLTGLDGWLRRIAVVGVARTDHGVVLRGDGVEKQCATIEETFPDYRAMLADLAPVTTRIVVGRAALLDVLDAASDPLICATGDTALSVSTPGGAVHTIPASGTGPRVDLAFTATTLRPAVEEALGPDIMFDISGPDQPVVVRSATDGDLTTLVMPRAIAAPTENEDTR
ncbi:MerR family transcriptional regulator [Nocardia sp. NPDC005366]|uniref:DNA polymerase III subunit beta family protein n=1 Tax=Nocardia sp. NPDC005366 TaxID=3156878 RepID=UPI0033A4C718